MVSLIIGTEESVNLADCVHSQVAGNMEDDQLQGEQFMEAQEWSDEESNSDVEDFIVHCEGDTDVEELFPTPTYEELAAAEAPKSKEELHKEHRVNQAKLRAVMTRKVKKRAADYEAGMEDKGMTFSDQDSEDCKDLSDSSDDDGVVPKTSLSVTKRKSRAKKMQKRIYYDESRENAHDQMCLHMCFADVHQCRRALVNHHIRSCRNSCLPPTVSAHTTSSTTTEASHAVPASSTTTQAEPIFTSTLPGKQVSLCCPILQLHRAHHGFHQDRPLQQMRLHMDNKGERGI